MDRLPTETVQQIFACLDDYSDVVALSMCSRLLHEISLDPLIWTPHLQTNWQHSNDRISDLYNSESGPKTQKLDDPYGVFRQRKRRDRTVKDLILSIVDNPHGRLKKVDAISDGFMDIVDAVRNFRLRQGRVKKNYGIDYYCCLIERHLSRKLGVHILQKMNANPMAYQDGLGPLFALYAIGSFRRSDGLDLHLRSSLDEIQANISQLYTKAQWSALPLYLDVDQNEPSKVTVLMDALHAAGIRSASSEDYYDLRNSFLYCTLKERRPTIPITIVAIFVALATRMELTCHPIGFPGQVLASIQDEDHVVYVAPYEGGRTYTKSELVARLHSYNMPDSSGYFLPCSVQELCIRSARNILNCIERGSDIHTLDGLYTALVTLKLTGQRLPLAEESFITLICLHFPYDINIWEQLGHPDHQEMIRRTRLEDVTIRRPKRRDEQSVEIRHRVGTIFRHALFNYVAV